MGGVTNNGAVFKITPGGALTLLYSFDGTHGSAPHGGLTLGRDGNLYGTTQLGGTSANGTIFKITSNGILTVLYNFTNGSDGAQPFASPVQATNGNFYGTATFGGGGACTGGCGTVYKMTPSGTFSVLYQFDNTHGANPYAPLIQATNGAFYGTAAGGGNAGWGVVFKITASGKTSVLYQFSGGADGAVPVGPVVQASNGKFYGTTGLGGTGAGTIFRVTATGIFSTLHPLNGTTDGAVPEAGMVQATDGNFYGVAQNGGNSSFCPGNGGCGTIFKVTPMGNYSVLNSFDLTTGAHPFVTPFQHTNGLVYGDTYQGGSGSIPPCVNTCGVFYSLGNALRPFVALLPYSGKVGDTIEVLGQGFTGATGVKFNGTAATFNIIFDTYLTTTVPAGATSGYVTVTESGGTLKSAKKFKVKLM